MKRLIRCSSAIIAASILAGAYKKEIRQGICSIKKMIEAKMNMNCECENNDCKNDVEESLNEKPVLMFIYKSKEMGYDTQPVNENTIKAVFEANSKKFRSSYVDANALEHDCLCMKYEQRFGISNYPCVLVLTPRDNLIAKFEAPRALREVDEFIKRQS